MNRIKTPHLYLLLGLIVPFYSSAANYSISVGGGFGTGGTSFIGKGFAVPVAGACTPWSGFAKTASTVILTSTGTGCLSSNGKVLTVSIFSTDPSYPGAGQLGADYIQLCLAGVTTCPLGEGTDQGAFGGVAVPEICTAKLLTLPSTHD